MKSSFSCVEAHSNGGLVRSHLRVLEAWSSEGIVLWFWISGRFLEGSFSGTVTYIYVYVCSLDRMEEEGGGGGGGSGEACVAE